MLQSASNDPRNGIASVPQPADRVTQGRRPRDGEPWGAGVRAHGLARPIPRPCQPEGLFAAVLSRRRQRAGDVAVRVQRDPFDRAVDVDHRPAEVVG